MIWVVVSVLLCDVGVVGGNGGCDACVVAVVGVAADVNRSVVVDISASVIGICVCCFVVAVACAGVIVSVGVGGGMYDGGGVVAVCGVGAVVCVVYDGCCWYRCC